METKNTPAVRYYKGKYITPDLMEFETYSLAVDYLLKNKHLKIY